MRAALRGSKGGPRSAVGCSAARGRRRRSRPAILPRGERRGKRPDRRALNPAFARRALCGMSGALRRPRRPAQGRAEQGWWAQARCSARLKGRADHAGAMGACPI